MIYSSHFLEHVPGKQGMRALNVREIGFSDIDVFEFQRGNDPEFCRYDSRPADSRHVECKNSR